MGKKSRAKAKAKRFGESSVRETVSASTYGVGNAFSAAFAEALKSKGPVWIECVIDKDEKVLPMIPAGGSIEDMIMD